jgi:cytochrome b subunit of formate dehydrogenase
MFRVVSIIGILITLMVIALHYRTLRVRRGDLVDTAPSLRQPGRGDASVLNRFRKLVYFIVLACFGVLVVTGFGPSLIVGEHPAGYLLMLHVTAAPIFAVSLAVLTLMWAYRCRFDQNDWRWLLRLLRREVGDKKPHPERSGFGQKVFFWLLVLFALSVILSITLSMFPLFGTQGQEFLSQLHRYSALLLVITAIAHTYLLLLCDKT